MRPKIVGLPCGIPLVIWAQCEKYPFTVKLRTEAGPRIDAGPRIQAGGLTHLY